MNDTNQTLKERFYNMLEHENILHHWGFPLSAEEQAELIVLEFLAKF